LATHKKRKSRAKVPGRGKGRPKGRKYTRAIRLEVSEEWLEKITRCAGEDGFSRVDWIRVACELVADEGAAP